MRTDIFISRPILSTVLAMIVVIAGAIAIPTIPIARFPELAPPSVTVAAIYTGANAQAVESAVTTPLEQVINGVQGMTYLQSSSTNSGMSTITVTFSIDRDPDLAAIDVQNRVNQALGRMPADVRTNGISVIKNTSGFMGGLGFFSRDNRYDAQFISNYLDRYVRDAIKRVPGVGDVIIFGERRYAMRLWLDPGKLAARGLTASDVVNALREQNVQVAAGALGDAPAAADQMFNLSVRAQGRLTEVTQFADVVIAGGRDGALVRVSDVGRVELGAENYTANLRFLGLEASGMGVQLLPSANALDVYDGVLATMARIEQDFPPGLEWRLAFDQVTVVRESITEVLKTLGEALLLVVLVMFLFLQNWRSTIIPALTIPVSLIGTFAFVKLFGFSINTLTLFGIVLAIGIVVDDAIVVVENIERHMREFGKSAYQAAVDAMQEVLSAVIVIGIVLVAVFVPVAFFPGTTGRLYQQFSLTIAFAVVLSVFNALTLTPALAALLLDTQSHAKHGWFFTQVNKGIDAGTHGYVRMVSWALRWRWAMLVVFAVGLGGTFMLWRTVPTSFVPDEDEGYFISIVQAPPGASLEYTDTIAKQAEKILYADPDIQSAFSVMGFSFSGAAPNNGLIFTMLKPLRGAAAARPVALGGAQPHPRPDVRHHRRDRRAVCAAGDSRTVGVRRLPVRGARPERRRHRRTGRGHGGAVGARQRVGAGDRALQQLPRRRPAAGRGHRSRQGPRSRPAAARGHRCPPGVPRLAVRQRLRLQQPGVSRLRPGRPGVSRQARGPQADLRSRRGRPDGAARHRRPGERDDLAAGHQPLQHVPLSRAHRRGGAGRQLGRSAGGDGEHRPHDAAARLRLRLGRTIARRDQRRFADAVHLRAGSAARLPGAGRAVRELGPAVHHPARRAAGGAGRPGRPVLARLRQRRLLPGRAGAAGRPGRQELHPDRRVRRAAARSRAGRSPTRRSKRPASGCGRS